MRFVGRWAGTQQELDDVLPTIVALWPDGVPFYPVNGTCWNITRGNYRNLDNLPVCLSHHYHCELGRTRDGTAIVQETPLGLLVALQPAGEWGEFLVDSIRHVGGGQISIRYDAPDRPRMVDGEIVRTLSRVELAEVSFVVRGANDSTAAGLVERGFVVRPRHGRREHLAVCERLNCIIKQNVCVSSPRCKELIAC
jgi:hypothetical protein